jgi:hypothetical protein
LLFLGDSAKLKETEQEICEEIESRKQAEAQEMLDRKTRKARNKKRSEDNVDVASANQLASALGERIKPAASMQSKAKALQKCNKDAIQAQKSAALALDVSAIGKSRKKLFDGSDDEESSNSNSPSPSKNEKASTMVTDEDLGEGSGSDYNDKSSDSDDEVSSVKDKNKHIDDAVNNASVDNVSDDISCERCAPLRQAGKFFFCKV